MMPVYEFEGVRPVVYEGAYVHPSAELIGDVIVETGCYVGPCSVMRGDLARITMKQGGNLQDGCIIHSFPGENVLLEEDAHIGHGAVLHGCIIRKSALVGMNSVIMDGAIIGEQSMVAAMSFVKALSDIPNRVLVGGIPARVMRDLRDEEIAWKHVGTEGYQHLATQYAATLKEVHPLLEIEMGRKMVPLLKSRVKK